MSGDPPSRIGRPRDADLTRRLLAGSLTLVAQTGFHRLNADALTTLTRSGKAGMYRRWHDTTAVLAEALTASHHVEPPEPSGTVRTDLIGLLSPWTRPLREAELAAAAVLGPAHHIPALRAALNTALVQPLQKAVATILDDHAARGHHFTLTQRDLLTTLVLALWWDRLLTAPPASSPTDIATLVDRALLPMLDPPHAA